MRNRKLTKVLSTMIVLTVLAGLCFQFNLLKGKPDFSSIVLYGTLSQINIGVYFFFERIWLKHHRRGVLAAFWKYASFTLFTFGILIGWIFVYPFQTGLKSNIQTACLLLHVILPVEVVLEWLTGEKGHFQKQFRIFGIVPPVVYAATALILGAMKKGFGMDGAQYPYSFLNVSELGYEIVIPTCILYFILLVIWCSVVCGMDKSMYRNRKRKRI